MGRDGGGEITNHVFMARNKTEEKSLTEGPKSPKKNKSVNYPFYFREKHHNKKSLEGKFQKNTNRHKGNRKYCGNGDRKNHYPEMHYGPIISDRKKDKTKASNNSQRWNTTEKQTLPPRARRKIWPLG